MAIVAFDYSENEEAFAGIDDSKRLSPKRREAAKAIVEDRAVAACIVNVTASVVDDVGIDAATRAGAARLVANIVEDPEVIARGGLKCVLMDGNISLGQLPRGVVVVNVPKGDRKSLSIAAASVIAKVSRDADMAAIEQEYGFERNAGYGTPEHYAAIERLGPSAIHRKTFLGPNKRNAKRAARDGVENTEE